MKKYTMGFVNESMTRNEERDLAIELLDNGFFWLNDTMCKVCFIERNERHYFIHYGDKISSDSTTKSIIVSQLKEVVEK